MQLLAIFMTVVQNKGLLSRYLSLRWVMSICHFEVSFGSCTVYVVVCGYLWGLIAGQKEIRQAEKEARLVTQSAYRDCKL